jgi:ADP-ribose pyrophosphatase
MSNTGRLADPRAWIVAATPLDAPGLPALRMRYRRERGAVTTAAAGGEVDEIECTVLEGPDVVAAVVYDPAAGVYVLVRQVRPGPLLAARGAYGGTLFPIEIVAGVLDPGRSPEEMIRQEVIEETGLTPLAVEPLAVAFTNPALSAARAHFFLVRVRTADAIATAGNATGTASSSVGLGRPDEQEDISVALVPEAAVDDWIAAGRIIDTLSICGLLQARLRLRAPLG